MPWGRQTSVPTNELDTLAWYKEPGLKQLTDGTFEFITEAATVCDVADRRQGAMVVAKKFLRGRSSRSLLMPRYWPVFVILIKAETAL